LFFARARTGNKIDAKIPMMAITTSNSIKVNPRRVRFSELVCMTLQTLTRTVTFANGKDRQHSDRFKGKSPG
jgi:hypothetical protein